MSVLLENRQARHNYMIEDSLEAGVALEGWEVKAIRAGAAHIKEARVVIRDGEAYLVGMTITPLGTVAFLSPDPLRFRKLLMSRREIDRWVGRVERAGYTIVPLDLHLSRGRVKVQVGLAKGKKNADKRQSLKERDLDRDARQAVRQNNKSEGVC